MSSKSGVQGLITILLLSFVHNSKSDGLVNGSKIGLSGFGLVIVGVDASIAQKVITPLSIGAIGQQ